MRFRFTRMVAIYGAVLAVAPLLLAWVTGENPFSGPNPWVQGIGVLIIAVPVALIFDFNAHRKMRRERGPLHLVRPAARRD
jgi:integral membrane sensor domain MASE1